MLEQVCYTWCHDFAFLSSLGLSRKSAIPHGSSIMILVVQAKLTTIPSDILATQERSNLVLVNHDYKSIIVIELTVPFEQNIHTFCSWLYSVTLVWSWTYRNRVLMPNCIVLKCSHGLITDYNKCNIQEIFTAISPGNKQLKNKCKKFQQDLSISVQFWYIIFLFKTWPWLVHLLKVNYLILASSFFVINK